MKDKKEKEDIGHRFEKVMEALKIIKEKKEDRGKITCPCCGGDLHYTRASSNRHVWGKCKTEGCLQWMQ